MFASALFLSLLVPAVRERTCALWAIRAGDTCWVRSAFSRQVVHAFVIHVDHAADTVTWAYLLPDDDEGDENGFPCIQSRDGWLGLLADQPTRRDD